MSLYLKGEYPKTLKESFVCGNTYQGATCIIDNQHPGRDHWGPDEGGFYHQWPNVVSALASQPRPKNTKENK